MTTTARVIDLYYYGGGVLRYICSTSAYPHPPAAVFAFNNSKDRVKRLEMVGIPVDSVHSIIGYWGWRT